MDTRSVGEECCQTGFKEQTKVQHPVAARIKTNISLMVKMTKENKDAARETKFRIDAGGKQTD